MARLLIHAEDGLGERATLFDSYVQRLRALYAHGRHPGERAPLSVQINDLQGNSVLCINAAGPLVDVPLPAGTYHVTARLGQVRRAYTMTIESGASCDLYLRLSAERQ